MKKCVGIILTLFLLLSVVSGLTETAKAPAFTWGMSKSDAARMLESEGSVETYTISNPEQHVIDYVLYTDQQISKFTAPMFLIFQDDQLAGRCYILAGYSWESAFQYLTGALSKLYGLPDTSPDALNDPMFMRFFDMDDYEDVNHMINAIEEETGLLRYETWKIDENTSIILMALFTEEPKIAIYFGHPVSEDFNLYGL